MPYLDGCPECLTRDNAPTTVHEEGEGVRAHYRCSACLWSWTTGWAAR